MGPSSDIAVEQCLANHPYHTPQLRQLAPPLPGVPSPPKVVPEPAGWPPRNLLLWRVVKRLALGAGQAEGVGRAAQAAQGRGEGGKARFGGAQHQVR